ncbi:AAA domain-containing protein [Fusarium falciforme]|uniref:AAA domain-containing protein n=1 Tax=Fusarium falciforme TaxID=195108 RepID=UPI002300CAF1|nr:AAA domain-containing protein [Fusarium falciforme]WAO87190.1 AAA domain-containing protein [Fusarium falciforme]
MAMVTTQVMTPPAEDGQIPVSDLTSDKVNGHVDPQKEMNDLTTENTVQPLGDGDKEHGFGQLQERFAAMEAKLKLIDSIVDLRQTFERLDRPEQEVSKDGVAIESMTMNELSIHHEAHLDFYWDAMWFMKRARDSHDSLLKVKKAMKEKRDAELLAKSKSLTEKEPEASRKLSVGAFLKGEKAKVVRVDWLVFIASKGELESSILTPIEVISSEPEPQTILQLPVNRTGGSVKAKSSGHRVVDSDKDQESAGERPLPERIKIHSGPLVAIFCRVMDKKEWSVAKDKSMVFLRPYRQLVYHETKLREYLADLEKQFEGYDGTEPLPEASEEQGESDKEAKESEEASKPTFGEEPEGKKDDDQLEKPNGSVEEPQNTNKTDSQDNQEEEKGKDGDNKEEEEKDEKHNTITGLLHLRCLMDFFDKNIKAKLDHISSPDYTHVSFHDIWHLFKPGDRVVDQTEKQAYVILRVQTPRHKVEEPWLRWYKKPTNKNDSDSEDEGDNDEGEDPVMLHCVYIDFDGKQFGPVSKKFKIPQFGELKDIRSLPVYPFRHAKNKHLQEDFIKRGKMLLDVAKFKPMYYMGLTLDTRDEIDSQVVVDFNEALADEKRRKKWEPTIGPVGTAPDDRDDEPCMASCCDGQAVHDGEYIDSTLTENYVRSLIPKTSLRAPSLLLSPRPLEDLGGVEGLTEEELVVMTYRVFGFVLRSRKWAQLDLTFLRYENADARSVSINAFERLELPAGHREMVKSLVIQHFRSRQTAFTKDEQTDLIKGKGKGLIMLLHGAPGVGKTTTAEGIAELFKKPLFQITCGDLGTTAREVEEELEKNFALASRWGCILLLDEADVFLSARERMDFKRNGLVAVFLRVLEYYTGILFLTTNRIGDFDEAFASRVHMSLYYPELDEEKTLKVFELNLDLIRDRFKKQGREIIFDASSIEDFAKQHFTQHKYSRWNGRQIRNLCQTALALAEFDAQGGELDAETDRSIPVSLQLKHFKTVQAAYLSFGEYLGDIRGTKGDRRAIDYGLRARQDTPYQTKSSRFAQKAEEMSSHEWHGHATTMSSDASHYRVASQGDPFQPLNQGHMQPNQSMGVSPQGYRQYQQPQQQQMAPMGNMGFGMSGQPGQSQTDPRMMQNQQSDGQYMRYQQNSQGYQQNNQSVPRNTNVNFQGSPIPQNSFQSQPEQGYGGVSVHQVMGSQVQVPSISMRESSSQGFVSGSQTGQDMFNEQNHRQFVGNEGGRM